MEVELALLDLMRRHGIGLRGEVESLGKHLGVSRQTISKLLNNRSPSLSLAHVAKICSWLLEHPAVAQDRIKQRELAHSLPGALFRFSGLWARLLEVQGMIVFLGERYLNSPTRPLGRPTMNRWISGADAEAARRIAHGLLNDGARYTLEQTNVRLQVGPQDPPPSEVASHHAAACDLYDAVRRRKGIVALIVGSQRVNPVTEAAIASLYASTAFQAAASRVPFYTQYRTDDDPSPPSCFGGVEPPPNCEDRGPGIYHRQDGRWGHSPWVDQQRDSGIVVVDYDRERRATTVVLFGFSGPGTGRVGDQFLETPELFWPARESRRFGSFLCKGPLDPKANDPWQVTPIDDDLRNETVEAL